MNEPLAGRTIIVTGAGRGIGRASALRFAQAGAKVVVSDINEDNGRNTSADIIAAGGIALFVKADISVESDVKTLVDTAVSTYGRLDGALNNAALLDMGSDALHEVSAEKFRRDIAINIVGPFLCLKYEIQAMLNTGGGAIVNMASTLGLVATPGSANYITAKHAVIGMTRSAAVDYAPLNIRINALAPTIIHTEGVLDLQGGGTELSPAFKALGEMHPIRRIGTPEEVAEAALWLLSDASSLVVGTAMVVDGGYTAL